ncbi:MAG TPA: hypothetical protein VF111_03495 [Thermoanaerobaculia bacterium]
MSHPTTPADLPEYWRALAVQQRSLGAEAQACTLEFCAGQLDTAQVQREDELLTLQRAADESGYSMDHLGRMLREGDIPNAGRKSKPLIRRGDLPVKSSRRKATACVSPQQGYHSDGLFRHIAKSKS